jgi:hypothetical protein
VTVLIKLLGTVIGIGAGFAATKVLDKAWEKGTGHKPPKDPTNLEASLRDTLVFALVASSVGAAVQVFTQRYTQKAIARFNSTPEKV